MGPLLWQALWPEAWVTTLHPRAMPDRVAVFSQLQQITLKLSMHLAHMLASDQLSVLFAADNNALWPAVEQMMVIHPQSVGLFFGVPQATRVPQQPQLRYLPQYVIAQRTTHHPLLPLMAEAADSAEPAVRVLHHHRYPHHRGVRHYQVRQDLVRSAQSLCDAATDQVSYMLIDCQWCETMLARHGVEQFKGFLAVLKAYVTAGHCRLLILTQLHQSMACYELIQDYSAVL